MESVLAFFVEVRKEKSEAGEGRVGDHCGLCHWGRMGRWHGEEERPG